MLTEFHCLCGHIKLVDPAALSPSMKCGRCGSTFAFVADSKTPPKWLFVGNQSGEIQVAVPVPFHAELKIGSDPGGWLQLSGDGIGAVHSQLQLGDDRKLTVKHVGGAAGTWINRCKIVAGVLGEKDELRIGPHRICLATSEAVIAASQVRTAEPRTESPETTGYDYDDDTTARPAKDVLSGALLGEGVEFTTKYKVWFVAAALGIVAALGFVVKWAFIPSVSADMPRDTEYRCPVDGTRFRAAWAADPPKCPTCKQAVLGMVKFATAPREPVPSPAPPTTRPAAGPDAPTSAPATAPAVDSAATPTSPDASEAEPAPLPKRPAKQRNRAGPVPSGRKPPPDEPPASDDDSNTDEDAMSDDAGDER